MAITIRWKIPSTLDSTKTHDVKVYRSTNGEDGDYQLLATISAGGGNTVKTYATGDGDGSGYFYYVKYLPSGGSEGDRVLAVIEPGVKEQRLAEQVNGHLPEIIKARVDSDLIDVRKAMQNALDIINAYSPQTSYAYTNLPGRYEGVLVPLALSLLYLEKHLQISIRDYSYGGTGINFNVDRGAKINTSVQALQKTIGDLLQFVKHPDWPTAPLGIGTDSISTPQSRIYGIVFGTSP